jgi:hypothetical protein
VCVIIYPAQVCVIVPAAKRSSHMQSVDQQRRENKRYEKKLVLQIDTFWVAIGLACVIRVANRVGLTPNLVSLFHTCIFHWQKTICHGG